MMAMRVMARTRLLRKMLILWMRSRQTFAATFTIVDGENGAFVMEGSGHGVHAGGVHDGYYFIYQPISGDFDVHAFFEGPRDQNAAKTGIVFTTSSAVHPTGTGPTVGVMTHFSSAPSQFYKRAADSQPLTVHEFVTPKPFAGLWLRLQRKAGKFRAFTATGRQSSSADAAWVPAKDAGWVDDLPPHGWIGFAVTSQNRAEHARVRVSNAGGLKVPHCEIPSALQCLP